MDAAADAPLPPGWTLQTSKSTGKTYWFNSKTGESTYSRPTFPNTAPIPPSTSALPNNAVQLHQNAISSHNPALALRPAPAPSAQHDLKAPGGVAMAVASAYDNLREVGLENRRESSILHLKSFNNWVKAVLIAEYAPQPTRRVLDLACGKLGDLQKWRLAGVQEYCGIDISAQGIEDARGRFNGTGSRGNMAARLIRADLGACDLAASRLLDAGEQFDAISIQFALHYLFQSEARALTFFRNIADRLAPGGVFLGTLPDAAYLVRRLRDSLTAAATQGDGAGRTAPGHCGGGVGGGGESAAPMAAGGGSSGSNGVVAGESGGSSGDSDSAPSGLSFGNDLYRVTFDEAAARRQWALGHSPYGVRYRFYLAESVGNVDEYLVPWPLLERLAASVGLVPLCGDSFHSFYSRLIGQQRHRQTARSMRVMNAEGGLTAAEWEVAGVYRVFAFQRPAEGAASAAGASTAAAGCAPGALPSSEELGAALRAAGEAVYSASFPAPVPYKRTLAPEDVRDVIAATMG